MAGTVRIGTSGWRYPPWRGHFYPPGLAQRRELEYLSRRVDSIEVNASFYALQRPSSYRLWRDTAPDGFVFAVKGPKLITHVERLRGVGTALANFFASGVLALGPKLGPVLWQLPPSLPYRPDLLADFLALLPRTTGAAAELADRSDLDAPERGVEDPGQPLRHAMEVRHPSFLTPGFVEQLRAAGVASVVADTAGRWPRLDDVTADFAYVRLHGHKELYVSGYTDDVLDEWADHVRLWRDGGDAPGGRTVGPPAPHLPEGRDVYVYFDNTVEPKAPFDALALADRLGQARVPSPP